MVPVIESLCIHYRVGRLDTVGESTDRVRNYVISYSETDGKSYDKYSKFKLPKHSTLWEDRKVSIVTCSTFKNSILPCFIYKGKHQYRH